MTTRNWYVHRRAMPFKLFCYGTLCIPAVMRQVCGRLPPALTASLDGYIAVALTARTYPGIRPKPASCVQGLLYDGLSKGQLAKLDDYEGAEYRRCVLRVTDSLGQVRRAWTYVLQPRYYYLATQEPWSLSDFTRDELALYLNRHNNKLAGQHGRDPDKPD